MSNQTLKRKHPLGTGVEAVLAAIRNPAEPPKINHPPEDVKILDAEGHTFTFDSFTLEDASELGHLVHAKLLADPHGCLISISLANGLCLYQSTTKKGVNIGNQQWAVRKTRAALRWRCSSWYLHCKYDADEAAFAKAHDMTKEQAEEYAIHGGCIPIYVQGSEGIYATIVVSGLVQQEDHGVIVDVVKENWEPVK